MEDSLSNSFKIREYIKNHMIEQYMNESFNKVLKSLPSDPFSSFIEILKIYCSESIMFLTIEIGKTITCEFKIAPTISCSLRIRGMIEKIEIEIPISSLHPSINDDTYEKAAVLFKDNFASHFKNEVSFNDLQSLDSSLESIYSEYEKFNCMNSTSAFALCSMAKNISNTISTCAYLAISNSKQVDLQFLIRDIIESTKSNNNPEVRKDKSSTGNDGTLSSRTNLNIVAQTQGLFNSSISSKHLKEDPRRLSKSNLNRISKYPNLGVIIFKCGKGVSKVKFDKFMLIIDLSHNPSQLNVSLIFKAIMVVTKKILTAGKLGENGFRINLEGSHFSPYDTINDTVKILEEIIKELLKDNSLMPLKMSIGIDCSANGFYNESTKKYDIEGMKNPSDSDGMVDYYLKYLTEHPLITYLEDPMADSDIQGWKKLFKKMEEKNCLVKVCCKNLIGSNLQNLKTHLIPIKMDEAVRRINLMKLESQISPKEDPEKFMNEVNNNKILPSNCCLKYSEFPSISLFLEAVRVVKGKKFTNLVISDSSLEYHHSIIIDLAFASKADMIILSGISSKIERMNNFLIFLNNLD